MSDRFWDAIKRRGQTIGDRRRPAAAVLPLPLPWPPHRPLCSPALWSLCRPASACTQPGEQGHMVGPTGACRRVQVPAW